jgi:hypothetical protein
LEGKKKQMNDTMNFSQKNPGPVRRPRTSNEKINAFKKILDESPGVWYLWSNNASYTSEMTVTTARLNGLTVRDLKGKDRQELKYRCVVRKNNSENAPDATGKYSVYAQRQN